jgi:hypothetical protein
MAFLAMAVCSTFTWFTFLENQPVASHEKQPRRDSCRVSAVKICQYSFMLKFLFRSGKNAGFSLLFLNHPHAKGGW